MKRIACLALATVGILATSNALADCAAEATVPKCAKPMPAASSARRPATHAAHWPPMSPRSSTPAS